MENYLISMPQKLGKPLIGKYKGLYRYRYGDFLYWFVLSVRGSRLLITVGKKIKNLIIVGGDRCQFYF